MQATLLILAAGMGSRYGALKQLDAMGPSGETVLDYSVFDAIRAGFGKVVFVIRRDFEAAFREQVGDRFEGRIEVAYAFQELDDLPEGFSVPEGRTKPWGTAHAVRAARHEIDTPFAVINADDFYGAEAYVEIRQYFQRSAGAPELRSCMVGYPLANTLSAHGSVNRGLCRVEDGCLLEVTEHEKIRREGDGRIFGCDASGGRVAIDAEAIVSMNFWGFTPAIFLSLEAFFTDFLENAGSETRSECYLPAMVDHLIRSGQTECAVLTSGGRWFGVTYPDDKAAVQARLAELVAAGEYPARLS